MSDDKQPHLASLVQAGQQQTHAERITDNIHLVKDISNLYLVNTRDGDVLINAGFMASAERNKKLLELIQLGPLRYLLLTQGHGDHFGGVPALREADTKIIAQEQFVATCQFFNRLMPYFKRRSGKLWASTIKGRDLPVPEVIPDITFSQSYSFVLGDTAFEMISTPGGEAPDASIVWLPKQKVVFTGNLFGPVFLSMPNLCTLRGDKPRSALLWLECLRKVKNLHPEILITGHGEPIFDAEHIQACLNKMHDAVSFIVEATLDGMNAGKDVNTLMQEVQLPEHLKIGEFHGKVSWAVKSIWQEHSGWFYLQQTSELYAKPRSIIDGDLVELAGGAAIFAERALQKLENNDALAAMHLLEVALGADPDHQQCLAAKVAVLEQLLQDSNAINLSETMWLKTELAATATKIAENSQP